jgi:hypothetical protein
MDFRECDPFRFRAEDQGCNTCGARGDEFYTVSFYILPVRLVRKRHKDRKQVAIYCRECYERAEELPYLMDGQLHVVSKHPKPEELEDLRCAICAIPYRHGTLYGVISYMLWRDSSIIEQQILTFFCDECIKSHKFSLVAKLTEYDK